MNIAYGQGTRRDSRAQAETPEDKFARHLDTVRRGVDTELARLFEEKLERARMVGAPAFAAVSAASELAMRGGKRQRPAILAAAYEACGGCGGPDAVVKAGVSLELLQTYFLIHDDWMDASETRRGGPSVHMLLAATFGGTHDGNAAAILAGDHACALAQEALLDLPLPAECILAAVRELARIQQDVIAGQLLDVDGASADADAMEKMHDLKTGSYTVRGPLELGAVLAGATSAQHALLERFARPLGVAFQLRDDLLGTFGDASVTGKPSHSDIASGKPTALVIELASDPEGRHLLTRVLGKPDAAEEEVEALVRRMIASGAKRRVEERIVGLVERAIAELDRSSFTPRGRALLVGAASALAFRER
jgi:geranylgeranyl diphosphate synthase type I